ncbi:MAG: hypothetical protein K2N51_05355 [Lachnospiraceae bacterium]|nr:hypothetical protein [Lachnospiraceae bacterium]
MDIQALGILSSIAAQGNTNTIVDKGNNLSFSQIFSEIKGTNQISAKDMFSAAFPTNDVSVKAGNCDISSEIWERKDFPVWQYFQDDVSTNSLNNWKPSGAQPTGAESYIQQELKKIGFGEIVVMFPESLQNKMEANPEYAQEIAEKLQKWKANYDRMDNAVAASYGDDPILYQMTKSYCIQLDEDGNVKNYTVVSGGIDTKKSDDTNRTYNEAPQKTVVKTVKPKSIQMEVANTVTRFEEVDYTNIAPCLVDFYKNKET